MTTAEIEARDRLRAIQSWVRNAQQGEVGWRDALGAIQRLAAGAIVWLEGGEG